MENMHEHTGMAGGAAGTGGMNARLWHWACCVWPILACLLWVAAAVFVVLSWISVMNTTGEIWGLGPQWYIWNAVMLGILAIPGCGRKMGHHGACVCGVCK